MFIKKYLPEYYSFFILAEDESIDCIQILATVASICLMILTFPIAVFLVFKVVQEYERSVIFRMGRLR